MSVIIISKRSGSKLWGWATGPEPELVRLAWQVHAEIKPATGNQPDHLDLSVNQVKQAVKRGAQIK